MVLQVGTHLGRIHFQRNAVTGELGGRAYPRQHQDLRRADRPRAQQDLGTRTRDALLSIHPIAHTERTPALDQHLGDHGPGLDQQITAPTRRLQIAVRRRTPARAHERGLIETHPFLGGAVEIPCARDTCLFGGLNHQLGQWRGVHQVGHHDRAVPAVMRIIDAQVALHAPEIRRHLGPAPARRPRLHPVVVVLMLAADVDQAIDGRAAAEHLAARQGHAPAAQAGFGLGLERPVEGAARVLGLAPARRHVDHQIVVTPTSLEQQHAASGVFGQARRRRAARAARADDDVVEAVHLSPPGSACSARDHVARARG